VAVRRRHLVLAVGILEAGVIQDPVVDDPRVSNDRRLAGHGEIERCGRVGAPSAGDDRAVLVLLGKPHEDGLALVQLVVDLGSVGPPVLVAQVGPFVLRPQSAGEHREELLLLGRLDRKEEMGLVLDDRAAERGAVLITAVVGFRLVLQLLEVLNRGQ